MKRKNLKKVFLIFILVMSLLNLVLFFGLNWIATNVGIVSIDEIIFHIKVPLTGTNRTMIIDIIIRAVIPVVVIFTCLIFFLYGKYKYTFILEVTLFKKKFNIKIRKLIFIMILLINTVGFVFQLIDIENKFKIMDYIKSQTLTSTFIEDNYVDSKTVELTFPEKKRNLIYIYMESMETTFSSKKTGGKQNEDMIPELTALALNNTNFSNNETLGGAHQVTGTGWTIAGMVAQTAGIPLKLPFTSEHYIGFNKFLPGVYNLGDILNDNGYTQVVMFGSDAKFAGRDTYFKTHGNYKIKDYYAAIEEGIIDKNHRVFWGMEDSYLFTWAKQELKSLSKQQPFNLTMLTVNTHFPDGYLENSCSKKYGDNQYANTVACSSKQIGEFVDWIMEQDFYENTTIVLVGDHLSMAENSILNSNDYTRTPLNIVINSSLKAKNNKNRIFTAIDMFPTTLASLGVKIENNKLGLGTNLYSDELTMVEKYGVNEINAEFAKKSIFYNEELLYKN